MNELEVIEEVLTAEERSFCSLVSKGYSQTQAYRMAFPAKAKLKSNTIRNYAVELMTKSDVLEGIETATRTQARLARLSENRLEQILTEGSINSKTNKVAEVSMFMYEQANGKATQKIESKSAFVSVVYDLSGGAGGNVPDDILKQLENIN